MLHVLHHSVMHHSVMWSGVEWYILVLWSGLVWCGVLELTKVDFLFSSLDIHSFGIYCDSEKNA